MEAAPQHPVPVFPLPNVVLFPRAVAPLHVFELRYRTLVRDALSGERLIALAVLAPGWEREYHASPPFHDLGCLGRVDAVEWLPDDCYDLRVVGVSRVRIERVTREFPYRAARVSLLPQAPYTEDDPLVTLEKRALVEAWRRLTDQPLERLAFLPRGTAPYEAVVNAVGMALPAAPEEKLAWLALDSVLDRGQQVREWMERAAREPPAEPPPATGDLN